MPPKAKKEKGHVTNWYKTALVQKHMTTEEPYPFEDTQIKVNSRILCVGTTGSGKSNALLDYISLSPRTFSKVIVVHKEQEAIYQALQDGLGGNVTFMTDLGKLPRLDAVREGMMDGERLLLVIDDWVATLDKYPQVNDYFIRGRKKWVTVFLLAQSYYKIPLLIRQQMGYLLLFKMPTKRDVDCVLDTFSTPEVDRDQLRALYKNATKRELNFLKIRVDNCPINEKFSRNFDDFYTIDEGDEDDSDG